ADRNRQREAEKRDAENGPNHLRRMRFVDRIEEDALDVGGAVGAQRRGDARGRQRQRAHEKQSPAVVGDAIDDRGHGYVHHASTGGSVNTTRLRRSTAAFNPSSTDASASS